MAKIKKKTKPKKKEDTKAAEAKAMQAQFLKTIKGAKIYEP